MAKCNTCGNNLFHTALPGALLKSYCPGCEKPAPKVILVKDGIKKQKPVELPWGEPDGGRIGTICACDGSFYVWSPSGWILAGTKDEGFIWTYKKRKPNSRREAILAQRKRKRN